MLEIAEFNSATTLLDFGCGCSGLMDYIKAHNIKNIDYHGLDISKKFIEASKKKYPNTKYYLIDVLKNNIEENFDYIIMNGVLKNVKRDWL